MSSVPAAAVQKGALISKESSGRQKVISFQYNPATLHRTLQPNTVGAAQGDRSAAVRFTGAPSETIHLEIALNSIDRMDRGDADANIYPQLAALELLVYPELDQVTENQAQLSQGRIEVVPLEAPRTLFVWGKDRVLPVRLTGFTITEQLFSSDLDPIRATVAITLRVISYSDVDHGNPDWHQFLVHQQQLAATAKP